MMYSKKAMDEYQRLLNRELPLSFSAVEKTASEKTAITWKGVGSGLKSMGSGLMDFTKHFLGGRTPGLNYTFENRARELASKGRRISGADLERELSKLYPYMPNMWRASAAVGIPGAAIAGYSLRDKKEEVTQDYDKLKYGLGGLAAGIAAPMLLNKLTSPNSLGARQEIYKRMGVSPEVMDFTSI